MSDDRLFGGPVPASGPADERSVMVDGHALQLTHLRKPFWPELDLAKEDLLRYYDQVAAYLLPHLKGRPQSLHRQPHGARDKGFFQKDIGPAAPAWVHTCALEAPSVHRTVNYLLCDDRATLLYMVNLGCIELHPWLSRLPHLDRPDHLVIDLDPSPENTFDEVVEVALAVKEVLDRIGAVGLCKTSGASGMHVHVPLGARYPYAVVAPFAHALAIAVDRALPLRTTLERTVAKRGPRIYIDHQQNHRGHTVAAPYSVRPTSLATVAAPLRWEEVRPGLDRSRFTLRTMPARLARMGDLFAGVLGPGIDLPACMARLERHI